jgi:hypothetical protein
MDTLIRCVYASKATSTFHESMIPAVLERSRANNAASGITGMLLYMEGNFFQVLEGPEAAVDAVFGRIGRDDRHGRVTRIIREPIARRDFSDWTMGFQTLEVADLGELLGENDFFDARSCVEQLNRGRARKLLEAFAKGRWNAASTGIHRVHARAG